MKKFLVTFSMMLLAVAGLMAQRNITGTVTDDKGEALIGATILVKGTSVGTATDIDGSYTLTVPAGNEVLVFSYTGFSSQEVTLGPSNIINVTLSSSSVALDEIIVTGYGAQAKRDVTGSISKVKGDVIANLVTPSFDQQMAGRAAGVQVTPPNGILGQPPQIRIRGVNSISSGTAPLVVIDGVPAFSGNFGGFTPANGLADINPADIESLEVLKDGAATAIFGSRAANGVVLITTKKGQKGKAKFSYDGYAGTARATNLFDLLNAQEFVTIQNEKNKNKGGTSDIALLQELPGGGYVETDWMDVVFRDALQQSHTFSVNGGTDNNTYYFSLGYSDQQGIAVANSLSRYSFRANLDQKVNNWLKVGFNSGATNQENLGPLTGSNNLSGNTFAAMRMLPNVAVYDPTDPTGYNIDDLDPRTLGRGANKVALGNGIPNQRFVLDNDKRRATTWRLLGNSYLDITPFKGLNFRSQIGIDFSYSDDFSFQDPRHGDGFSAQGRISQAYGPSFRWNWQNILTYNNSIAGNHNIGVTLVQEYQKSRSSFYQAQVSALSERFFQENLISGTYSNQFVFGGVGENGLASYMARVNYNFANKYYISGSIRRDALSSLPEDGRIGYFPGVSFAYRISEEPFWKNSIGTVVSDFRLRGSWAETGNTNIGNYPYIGSYGPAQYGTQNGIAYNNFGNDKLTWESQQKLDLGFDLGLFDGRYSVSAAFWSQDNDDIILAAPQPPSVGIPGNVINTNIGRVKSSGIELTLDAEIIRKADFRWNASFNFTTQNSEVLALLNDQDIIGDYNIIRVGESLNAIYGFDYWGVNPANGNPVYQKADGVLVQGNIADGRYYRFDPANPGTQGEVSSLSASTDRRVLGTSLPKFFGGFDNRFYFKGFDLNIFLRFVGGNVIMNRTRIDLLEMAFNNNGREILGRWQSAENPGDGQTPKIVLDNSNFINQPNFATTRFVEKGDFVRLGNLSLGYTLPKAVIQKLNIETLRIYVQGQNLLTITDYQGIDPETNTNGFGVDFNGNPQQRVLSFGLNLGF